MKKGGSHDLPFFLKNTRQPMENSRWTVSKTAQFLAFVAMMVVMPALSWYYLRSGRDERRAAMAELKDFGKIPAFELVDVNEKPVSDRSLRGKLAILNFPKSAASPPREDLLHQFDNRDDVRFLSFYTDSAALVRSFLQGKFPKGNPRLSALALPVDHPFLKKMGEASAASNIPMERLFVLADTTCTLRRFYDMDNRSDMVRLVQQIALIMPAR